MIANTAQGKIELSNPDNLFVAGRFSEAQIAYANQLQAEPRNVHALERLTTLAMYDNNLESAEGYIEKLSYLAPESTTIKRYRPILSQRRNNSGEFQFDKNHSSISLPFVTNEPLPVVELTVNGVKGNFVIDTGAPTILIDPAFAQSAGLSASENSGEAIFGGGMRSQVQSTIISNLMLGSLTISNVRADIIPSRAENMFPHTKISGTLGTAIFYNFLTTIDYAGQQLLLRPKSASAEFQRDAKARGAISTQMWLIGTHFIVAEAAINGHQPTLMHIDSGGAGMGIQLSTDQIETAKVHLDRTNSTKGITPAGEVDLIPFRADVSIGLYKKLAVKGFFTPQGDPYRLIFPFKIGGTVSDLFFRDSSVTFDFVTMQMTIGG